MSVEAVALAFPGEPPADVLARVEDYLCAIGAPTLVRFWGVDDTLAGSALVMDGAVCLIQGVPGQATLGARLAARFPELRERIPEAVARAHRDRRLFGEVLSELGVPGEVIREELDRQMLDRLLALVALGGRQGLRASRHALGAVTPPTRFRPVPASELVGRAADVLGAPIELTEEVARHTRPSAQMTAAPPSRRAMLLEVLRLYSMTGDAGCLHCGTADGPVEIWVERGNIVMARIGAKAGAHALEHAAMLGLGSFSWLPGLAPESALALPIEELAALWSAAA